MLKAKKRIKEVSYSISESNTIFCDVNINKYIKKDARIQCGKKTNNFKMNLHN